jgi:hypothetical protein
MGRRWNVEKGTLLDTPTFEWLDAFEVLNPPFVSHFILKTINLPRQP